MIIPKEIRILVAESIINNAKYYEDGIRKNGKS